MQWTCTILNLLYHWCLLICTSIVFRDRGIVMWQSLLFSQLIKNNLSNRCGIAPRMRRVKKHLPIPYQLWPEFLNRYLTGGTPIFVTQRYTLHHAFQNLCEFIGHIFEKNGEISVRKRIKLTVNLKKAGMASRNIVIKNNTRCFKSALL